MPVAVFADETCDMKDDKENWTRNVVLICCVGKGTGSYDKKIAEIL